MAPRSRKQPKPKKGPRWPLWGIVLGLLVAFVGMLVADRVTGRNFLYGLVVTGSGIGIAIAALAAHLLGERLWRPGFTGGLAGGMAVVAVLLRLTIQLSRPDPSAGPPRIIMSREILLGVPIALAALALVLGAYVAQRTIQLPPGGLTPRARKVDLLAAVVALSGSLYTLGPLFHSLGIPLNHWTFLGLVALATAAFGVVTLFERLFSSSARRPKP